MSELTHALADLDEEKVKKLVCEKVDAGVDPMSIVDECRKGMDIVGGGVIRASSIPTTVT